MTYPWSDVKIAFFRLAPFTRGHVLDSLSLQPLPYSLANGVHFIGYSLTRRATTADSVDLVVAWDVARVQEPRLKYQFYAHMVDRTQHAWDKIDALDYNASQWSPGETIISWYKLRVLPGAPSGLYDVLIGMYDVDTTYPVAVFDGQGRAVDGGLRLGPVKVVTGPVPNATDAVIQHPQVARLDDQVTFLGYDLSETEARPGDVVTVALHWVAGPPRPDYTVFLHLIDQTGKTVAQVDSQPRNGEYPTSMWDDSEYVKDDYELTLPANLPSGVYRLEAGMYQLATGQRLPVTNARKQQIGDTIDLDSPVDVVH
jgi:hypothetical protein